MTALEKAIEKLTDRCNLIGVDCDVYREMNRYKALREATVVKWSLRNSQQNRKVNNMGFNHRYIASTEEYKGFFLELEMTQDYTHPSLYHRQCNVIGLEGARLAICKTKKEAKDLIDHNCFR